MRRGAMQSLLEYPRAPGNRKSAALTGILQPSQKSLPGDIGRGRGAFRAREVELQQVAGRHAEMLPGGHVALRGGNAGMPEREGKLFDRGVAFIGQPSEASPQVVRPYLGVHLVGMLPNDIVDGLCAKAFSGDFG